MPVHLDVCLGKCYAKIFFVAARIYYKDKREENSKAAALTVTAQNSAGNIGNFFSIVKPNLPTPEFVLYQDNYFDSNSEFTDLSGVLLNNTKQPLLIIKGIHELS